INKYKDHIKVSDDEDKMHSNTDTASLFRCQHQARVEHMKQFHKEKEELDRGCRECKQKVAERQQKTRAQGRAGMATGRGAAAQGGTELGAEAGGHAQGAEHALECGHAQQRRLQQEHSQHKPKPEKAEEDSEEVWEQKHKTFVEKYEKQMKHFDMLCYWDNSQKYLADNGHLACETANSLDIGCTGLEVEEKCTIGTQFILELAKSLTAAPHACFRHFFPKIQLAACQYIEGFNVRGHARLRMEKAVKEYKEEERKKLLDSGGLGPVEVNVPLPEELQKCSNVKDAQMLQDAISPMGPTDAKYHMQRCIDSDLWVPNCKSSEAKEEEEEGGVGSPSRGAYSGHCGLSFHCSSAV
uniref:Hsp90 co-chaperone Cdc37 n=1 Tax=Prolemur simus TaxID=1328070 RepID=A0A8C9A3V1_PROSS